MSGPAHNVPFHPLQPLMSDPSGTLRFKENRIVSHLLEVAGRNGCGLNELAMLEFSREDREQLAQLIGYSAGGFCTLSYVQSDTVKAVDEMADGGLDPVHAENASLKRELRELKERLKPVIADLYGIHPDNLDNDA